MAAIGSTVHDVCMCQSASGFVPAGSDHFHDQGRGLAAADADGCKPALQPALLQRMQKRCEDACPGSADRMADCNRAAVHIQLLGRDADCLLCCKRHHGECLVDLEQVDIANT